jgi:hypothetical protein
VSASIAEKRAGNASLEATTDPGVPESVARQHVFSCRGASMLPYVSGAGVGGCIRKTCSFINMDMEGTTSMFCPCR